MERRRDLRYEVQLRGRVQPLGGEIIDCMTINLSRSGALIRIATNGHIPPVFQPGDVVWAEVPLPAHKMFKQRALACKAVAVRACEHKDGWMVALRFERVGFSTAKRPAATVDTLAVM